MLAFQSSGSLVQVPAQLYPSAAYLQLPAQGSLELPLSLAVAPPPAAGELMLQNVLSSGSHRTSSIGAGGGSSGPSEEAALGKAAKPPPKNAQKRFRERQKELMSTLEREVAEKQKEFQVLAAQNEILKMRADILEKVVSCREEQIELLNRFDNACHSTVGAKSSCFGSEFTFPPVLAAETIEHYRRLKRDDMVKEYKGFLTEVSGHLLQAELHGPLVPQDSIAVAKINSAVQKLGAMMKHIMVLNPDLRRSLLSCNLETNQAVPAVDSHWLTVVQSLHLSDRQRHDVLAVFDLYRSLISKVYEERRLIMAAIGQGPETIDVEHCMMGRSALAQEMELLEKLQTNLSKEHNASTLLCCFFFGKVLEAAQFAKVAVYSWPYFPDALAVASVVAQQASYFAGGQQALQQLQQQAAAGGKV